ncbi:CBS domain-containing protein [Halosimplex salinum]|uniref:CBS domain-containing protein n=1 Tax=Halosimplex salinum TaxID=1710538 RepID=UPI000F46D663|nr:CBS domain-containing protein [Halosimplex salinum]
MEDTLVGSLMSSPVRTVTPDTDVQTAAQPMIDHGISSVVVVDDDNRLEGILTSTDYVRIAADGVDVTATSAAEYMATDLVSTSVDEPVHEVAETMMRRGVHHVPVADEVEGVVGMITTKDFAAYLSEARALSPPRPTDATSD